MAFYGCGSLTSIVIPEGVTNIGNQTFSGCSSLTSITLPQGVMSINYGTFSGCSSLTSITLPESVTNIDSHAFSSCTSLAHLVIPAGVKRDSYDAFYGCSDSLQIIADIDNIKDSDLRRRVALTYLQEPNAFTFGQDHVIRYIKSQKKQLLPEIFKNDLDYAMTLLLREKAITKANIDTDFLQPAIEANAVKCTAVLLDWKGENVTQEEEDRRFERELQKDLYNVGDMKKLWSYEKREDGTLCITSYKGEEKKIEVPPRIGKNAVTAIGEEAFSANKCGRAFKRYCFLKTITEIHLPDSVTSIGDKAFSGCSALTGIVIPDGVTSIGGKAFSGCRSLTSITIPEGVASIGSFAFSDCSSLASITIPKHIANIDSLGLRSCKRLADADGHIIVNHVYIDYCGNALHVVIPDGVTSIALWAFSDCHSLTDITIPASVVKISLLVFHDLTIHAPAGSYAAEYAKEHGIPIITTAAEI